MMTLEQLHTLCTDRQYKKTRGWYSNWKYSASLLGAPNISASDLNLGGEPYQQIIIILKKLFWQLKRYSVSKEIGGFRNDSIERILNPSLDDALPLIRPNMIWVEADGAKLEYIRRLAVEFVKDLEIQWIIFKVIKMEDEDERREFMVKLEKKINIAFRSQIAELKEGIFLEKEEDYNRYVKEYGQDITDKIKKRQRGGNLTGDLTKKTGGE
jgi:hypothetical protein